MSKKTRNLMWSAPLVAVFAVVGALALFMALAPNAALAHDPPGPVTSLAATADGYDTIKLSWGAPSTGGTPTGYRIDVSKDTYAWEPLVADTGNVRTAYTHDGLKPDSDWFYRVFALNAAGTGPSPVVKDQLFASATTGMAQAPSVILNLRAAASGSSKVVLTWAAPADNGGAEIARYCIIADGDGDGETGEEAWPMNTDPGDCTMADLDDETVGIPSLAGGLVAVSGNKTTFEHKARVSTAQTWRYRVYAINSANEAETDSTNVLYSNIARARTAGQSTLGKPTDLRIAPTSTNFDMFYLYWNWPKEGNKAAVITVFQYQSRTKAAGTGDWSDYAPAPDPSNATPGGGELHQVANADPPGAFENKGDQVQFRVRSVKEAAGDGDAETSGWTTSSVHTHQGTVADDMAVLTDMPTDPLTDDQKSLHTINLTWKKGNARASYIDMSLDEDVPRKWISLTGNTSYTRETYNHLRLEPGQTIYYRITPWHARGFGMAAPTTGATKTAYEPQAVRGLSVAADGQDKLTVSWTRTPTDDNGGSAVVGYLVQVAVDFDNNATLIVALPTGEAGWSNVNTTIVSGATVTDGAGGGSYTYTSEDDYRTLGEGLSAGSTRWFRVFAINTVNKGGPTDNDRGSAVWESGTTAGPSVPGAPGYLVAETARDSSGEELSERGVVLLWTTPVYSAGDTIRGYVIERSVDGGDWTELKSTVDGTDGSYTDYTDTEEPAATELRGYRVRVVTKGGTSEWSTVAYYPHALAMHNVTTGVLGKPTMVAAVSNAEGQAIITWRSGMNADSHDVVLYSGGPDYNIVREAENVTGMSHTFTGVAEGRYAAVVISAMGDDMWDYSLVWMVVQ